MSDVGGLDFGLVSERLLVVISLLLVAAIAGLAVAHRSRTLAIVSVAGAVGLYVATQGLPMPFAGPVASVIEWTIVISVVGIIYVGLTQQPSWLAERLGFAHRVVEWEFDTAVTALVDDFNRIVRSTRDLPADADRAALRDEARAVVTKLRRLRAPDKSWHNLAELYANQMDSRIDYLGELITSAQMEDYLLRGDSVEAEHKRLQEVYRQRARSLYRWP